MVALLGAIDVLTGGELSFSVFYLLPIFLATWLIGKGAGVLTSILSAITWLAADSLVAYEYSHALIPLWNMTVRLALFLITTYLLAELRIRLEQEKHSARTDPLTNIANRRYFYDLAEMEIAKGLRHGYPFTIAYIDLDNFKLINDSLGHQVGDRVLSLVATTIRDNLRTSDLVARVGGDEFAILLPQAGKESGQEVLARVRNQILGMMQENEWPVTLSIGVITFVRPPNSVDQLIKAADDLMYSVKHNGRDMMKHEVFQ